MQKSGKSFIGIGITIALLLTGGCRQAEINSQWKNENIIIDGDLADWQAGILQAPKGKPIAVGIQNDDSHLYITLSTNDRGFIMKAMRFGFTVWFDPGGGTKERFGIKYPTGFTGSGQSSTRSDQMRAGRRPGMAQMIRSLPESQPWIEIMGPGKNDLPASGCRHGGVASSAGLFRFWAICLRNEDSVNRVTAAFISLYPDFRR